MSVQFEIAATIHPFSDGWHNSAEPVKKKKYSRHFQPQWLMQKPWLCCNGE